jgi:hypothetical protein
MPTSTLEPLTILALHPCPRRPVPVMQVAGAAVAVARLSRSEHFRKTP